MTDGNRRLCLLINDLARAGAETQLVELALALSVRGYAVEILLLKTRNDFADPLSQAGIPVTALNRAGWWDLGVVFRLYRYLRRSRPDVLHCFLFLSNLLGVTAGRLAGVATIVVSQRCSYQAMLRPFWRRVARWSHRRADRVIVNSKATWREEIAAGLSLGRIRCIPNGVRFSAEDPPDRRELGLPEGPLVLSVGQLEAIKGHRWLLDAWPAVHASCPGATLVLLGDGSLRRSLEARARRAGVGSSVRFLGFRAPAPFLLACDFLVQPSLSEGMPNAVLEAMAAGRAVVATAVGSLPELIVDRETGILVPPRNAEALGQAILSMLNDPKRCVAMGDAARRCARDRFSTGRMVAFTEEAYLELVPRWAVPALGPWGPTRRLPAYRTAVGRRQRLARPEIEPGSAGVRPLPRSVATPRTTRAR